MVYLLIIIYQSSQQLKNRNIFHTTTRNFIYVLRFLLKNLIQMIYVLQHPSCRVDFQFSYASNFHKGYNICMSVLRIVSVIQCEITTHYRTIEVLRFEYICILCSVLGKDYITLQGFNKKLVRYINLDLFYYFQVKTLLNTPLVF